MFLSPEAAFVPSGYAITLRTSKKRLKALEEKVARDGIELTESQIAALERKASDDKACGEIETAHPGYLSSQNTFYVGNLKGVGRIYQQTFIDTNSKVAHCKLYNNERTHQGKMCCGRTPMETLLDGKRIWADKNLSQM